MKITNINIKKLLYLMTFSLVLITACKKNKTTENNYSNKTSNSTYNETIENNENNFENETYSNKDIIVINELNNIDEQLDEQNDESFETKAKGTFIAIVDFIFYDGTIKDITFDELTDKGKQEVLSIANYIDNKIENKIPNYKETISDKTKKAFVKASELIKEGSIKFKDFSKDKLGEENYNNIIEAKDELVEYSKKAIDIIGDFGSNLYNDIKDKFNNWYDEFKQK